MSLSNISSFIEILPMVIGAIFCLGLCIFVHELGHFLAARARGLKVTRFSIGMGPRLLTWTRNGVEYRISALPIGGYVALPQLADMGRLEGGNNNESEQVIEENLPPISFADKVIVASMGAIFNFIFAIILAFLLWWTGEPTSDEMLTTQVGYVSENLYVEGEKLPGPAFEAGVQPGDIILEVDGTEVDSFTDIQQRILTSTGRNEAGLPEISMKLRRGQEDIDLTLNPAIAYYNASSKDPIRTIGMLPADEIIIHQVSENSPASKAGLLPGDKLISANGVRILRLQTFVDVISEPLDGPVELKVQRADQEVMLELNPVSVARTKPLLNVTFQRKGQKSVLKLRPDFNENSKELRIDPESKADIIVHGISDIENGNVQKFRPEDRIIAVNGKMVNSLQSASEAFATSPTPVVQVTIGRNGNTQTLPVIFSTIIPEIEAPITQPMVGFVITRDTIITHVDPLKQLKEQVDITLRIINALFSRGSEIGLGHLSGPIGIVRQLTEITQIDPRLAIRFLILMNINLGILNLMPIPILDGGHILFAIIAKIRRKALPLRIVASLQGAFMVLLLSLMVFVLFKDSIRWHGDARQIDQVERMEKLYIDPVFIDQE